MPGPAAFRVGRRLLAALYTAVAGPQRAVTTDRTAPPAPRPDGLRRWVNQRTP